MELLYPRNTMTYLLAVCSRALDSTKVMVFKEML